MCLWFTAYGSVFTCLFVDVDAVAAVVFTKTISLHVCKCIACRKCFSWSMCVYMSSFTISKNVMKLKRESEHKYAYSIFNAINIIFLSTKLVVVNIFSCFFWFVFNQYEFSVAVKHAHFLIIKAFTVSDCMCYFFRSFLLHVNCSLWFLAVGDLRLGQTIKQNIMVIQPYVHLFVCWSLLDCLCVEINIIKLKIDSAHILKSLRT